MDAPGIVIFSFLSRSDATPLHERRRSPGHVLDRNGDVIADPAADPAVHAFGSDPNLNFETWGDTWRKVHGVRFLHSDDADDRSLDKLLRYDQIHRIAAGPSSLSPPPYRPPLDADGRLFADVIGHLPPYRRPAWDGAAYLVFASVDDIGTVLGSERVRTKILPEDRTLFREIAPLLARQYVILPSAGGRDAITVIRTHVRRADLDRATFQTRWLHDHADRVLAQPDTQRLVRRYVQLHNIAPQTDGAPFFHAATAPIDGISLMAFASMTDAEEFLISEAYRRMTEAEAEIASRNGSDYVTGLNFHLHDVTGPERATHRKLTTA
ncbi:EthD domain-containing protein [Bradyrhizobium sp. 2TAF24]|uniref:EthD domain-containing protein n=1 Tax=Bradyrhizobium sp. 2TAF24 TaxID=3233011 RepID=UPI003F8F298F